MTEIFVLLGIAAVLPFLAQAVRQDLTEQRVANGLLLFGTAAGFVFRLVCPVSFRADRYLADLILPILILFPLFLLRILGAGDLKLYSMISGFLGFHLTAELIFLSFLLGAAAGIVQDLLQKKVRFEKRSFATEIFAAAMLLGIRSLIRCRTG